MQNLIQLLKELNVQVIDPKIVVTPREHIAESNLSYQLQIDLESITKSK